MRSRILPAVGISALALVAAAAFAPTASASHGASAAHKTPAGQLSHSKVNPQAVCKSQRDNDNGIGIVSQNFEATYDIYDSQGADDFKTPAAGCAVRTVTADGAYFNGSGPAVSYNVTYYKNNAGTPGVVKKAITGASYTDLGFGTPQIKAPVSLKGGKRYWVSVQANMDFGAGGEWGWNTNNTVRGTAAQWQNPGNGFSTGCTTYTTLTTCIAAGEGGDFSFSINL